MFSQNQIFSRFSKIIESPNYLTTLRRFRFIIVYIKFNQFSIKEVLLGYNLSDQKKINSELYLAPIRYNDVSFPIRIELSAMAGVA